MININGKNYSGNNISIKGNRVTIDGEDVSGEDSPVIMITVDGNLNSLELENCDQLEIKGDCESVKTMSGDVNCNNITGNVKTMSGDVRCSGSIHGKVDTMSGDIKR